MTKQRILNAIKNFQSLSGEARQRFFSAFEKKMIYRTTKTENPETTLRMVKNILSKYPTEK